MSERPLILITNDDGVLASGLNVLAKAAAEVGEALVVAPEREMSGVSHAITLHRPLRVRRLAEGRFAVDGTPVDCVFVAFNHLAARRPALVVSGVNPGPNLGKDVLYSGTMAGAREGCIQGVPSIAFSLVSYKEKPSDELQPILVAVMRQVLAAGLPDGATLNVNIPDRLALPVRFEATRLGKRSYLAEIVERQDPRGNGYLWIGGGLPKLEDASGTDVFAVSEGRVSLCPVPMFAVKGEHIAAIRDFDLCRDNQSL